MKVQRLAFRLRDDYGGQVGVGRLRFEVSLKPLFKALVAAAGMAATTIRPNQI